MSAITERLEEATQKAESASEKLRQVVHGDATTEVMTDSGPVPSLSKWHADLSAAAPDAVGLRQDLQQEGGALLVGNSAMTFISRAALIAYPDKHLIQNGVTVFAGGCNYRREDGATIIPDLPGFVPSGKVTTRHFGALDGMDSTAALQAAISSGLYCIHDMYCLASDKLTHNGPVMLHGIGKGQCGIIWVAGIDAEGMEFTPSSWGDEIHVSGIDLLSMGDATETGLRVNYLPLGSSGIPYFDRRVYIEKVRISGTIRTLNGFRKGIVCDFPFAVEIDDCELYGKHSAGNKLPSDFVSGSFGIEVPDQANRTLANFGIKNTVIMGFHAAAEINNVEGVWVEDCDFQVCYDGLIIKNPLTKVNQYRIRNNHIGVTGRQVVVQNARQLILTGNEISYRSGRTDGDTVALIEIDGVYSFIVANNSIRGNVFNDTDVIVDGIAFKWDNSLGGSDYTRRGCVENNGFQNIRHAMRNDAGTNVRYISQSGNTFDGLRGKILSGATSANFTQVQRIGSGDFELGNVESTNTALHLVNLAASALTVDRQGADGAVVSMRRDGTPVGSISTTTTATAFNTTSDERLKRDAGYVSAAQAKEVLRNIKIHAFEWISTGEHDIGAFAQELHKVYPRAVTVGHGAPGDDQFEPWSVDYSKLVPLLIAAISDDA